MIKMFLTGDNHFGRTYARYPDIASELAQSRMDSFRNAIRTADENRDDFFVVSGDLFDKTTCPKALVKEVAGALAEFEGQVIVLPGNHDYYTGEEQVWKYFTDEVTERSIDNISLLNEFRPYEFEAHGEKVVFYPAFCESKHSDENNLGWIKKAEMDPAAYNIGIAHGALEGITPDRNQEYFLMTTGELEAIPVDAWLIGHTHIPYPGTITESFGTNGKIFNAGSHQQTDLHNNTEGLCFELTIDEHKNVKSRKIKTGLVRFADLSLAVNAGTEEEHCLENALSELVSGYDPKTIFRITVSGAVTEEEYKRKGSVYDGVLGRFLGYEIADEDLNEIITEKMITDEYPETSFAAKLLIELLDQPKEAQMAYDLMKQCAE